MSSSAYDFISSIQPKIFVSSIQLYGTFKNLRLKMFSERAPGLADVQLMQMEWLTG